MQIYSMSHHPEMQYSKTWDLWEQGLETELQKMWKQWVILEIIHSVSEDIESSQVYKQIRLEKIVIKAKYKIYISSS